MAWFYRNGNSLNHSEINPEIDIWGLWGHGFAWDKWSHVWAHWVFNPGVLDLLALECPDVLPKLRVAEAQLLDMIRSSKGLVMVAERCPWGWDLTYDAYDLD